MREDRPVKTIESFALAAVTAIGMTCAPLAANALSCNAGSTCYTLQTSSSDTLSNSSPVSFYIYDLSGSFTAGGSFTNLSTVPSIITSTVLSYTSPSDPGASVPYIEGLTLTIGGVSYDITDSLGRIVGSGPYAVVNTALLSGSPVDFSFTGTAVKTSAGQMPTITFNVSTVPVPATGFLLLGGLGALGVLRRRKKAVA